MMNRTFVGLIGLVLIAGFTMACESKDDAKSMSKDEAVAAARAEATEAEAAAAARAEIAAECRVDVEVTGMVCNGGCPPTVMSALEGVDGVAKVSVDFETKHASVDGAGTVCTDDGATALIDALEQVEFGGSVASIDRI